MKIYPINEQLEMLIASFVDPETGEVTASEEEMQAAIEQAQMDFDDKIVDLRNEYINRMTEAAAFQKEKLRLADEQKRAERSAERVKRWIAYLLKGEKFQKDYVKIRYIRSEEVNVDDGFVAWAKENFPSLLSQKDPEPNKTEIKKAIKAGLELEHASINQKKNIQIK